MNDDRRAMALRHLDLSGRGLEIGPSYDPLVPKASGRQVETLDHAPKDALVAKFSDLGVPSDKLAAIDDVDHVWTGGNLLDAVGEKEAFDYIVASHVIEHTVDLVGFLHDCEGLLKPSGRLALVVPDKRFCFDRFQPLSSTGSVVDAHLRPTQFHTPGSLLDHMIYGCRRAGVIAWSADQRGQLEFRTDDLADGRQRIAEGLAQNRYVDIHRWRFTPSSFALLIQELRALGYLSMAEVASEGTHGFEFFVTLASGSESTVDRDRLELQLAIEREIVDALDDEAADLRAGERRALDAHMAELNERSAHLEAQLEQAQARIGHLEELSGLYGQNLADMRQSSSWRVTRPLRAVSHLLRGHRHGA